MKGKQEILNLNIYLYIIYNYHTRFYPIYPKTLITIKKDCKNQFPENQIKTSYLKEFNYLKQNIDNDMIHNEKLFENNKLNRYIDIRPYKHNLVKINSKNKYINASWIHLPSDNFFIATQSPLDTTIEDFWQMCYEYNVSLIVILCQLVEKNKTKCANYWEGLNVRNFILENINQEFDIINGISIRNFQLKKSKNDIFPKFIIQLHYTHWKDHGVPDLQSYIKLKELIENIDYYRNNAPVVVHCSAGVGRTGTFIALYNLYIDIIKQIKDIRIREIKFSVMNVVRKLKEMRIYMVENDEQYLFLYQFVKMLLKEYNLI